VRLPRFVLASSSSIYGQAERFPTGETDEPRPVSPYGMTKLAAEQLCRVYGSQFDVPWVVLRYFSIFGPRQRPDMAFSRFIDELGYVPAVGLEEGLSRQVEAQRAVGVRR